MKKILLFAFVLALLGAYWYYHNFITGPKYSLLQAKKAAESHNMAEFEKYVNVESLTASLVDQITETPDLANSFIPGLSLGKGALDFLKPALTRAARSQVKNYVETGQIDTDIKGNELFFSLAAVAGTVISDDSQFKDVAYVNEQGNEALIGLEFIQPKADTTVILEIKMIDQGNYWQATNFTNAGELIQRILRRQKHAGNR